MRTIRLLFIAMVTACGAVTQTSETSNADGYSDPAVDGCRRDAASKCFAIGAGKLDDRCRVTLAALCSPEDEDAARALCAGGERNCTPDGLPFWY